MTREEEYSGHWWLPSAPEETVAGTLSLTPGDRPRLNLIGALNDVLATGQTGEGFSSRVVLGITTAGKPITLLDCIEVSSKVVLFDGPQTSTLTAAVAVVGHHFPTRESAKFEELEVGYDQLAAWCGLSGFTMRIERDKEEEDSRFHAEWSRPRLEPISLGNFELSFGVGLTHHGDLRSELRWTQRTGIRIAGNEPRSLGEYLDGPFFHVRNFISLGVGGPVVLTFVEGKPVGASRRVEILFDSAIELRPQAEVHQTEMLFTRADLGDDFPDCLKRWIDSAEVLRPAYDLFFASRFAPQGFLDTKFLTLAQAAETFHRLKTHGGYLSKPEFRRFLKGLRSRLWSDEEVIDESVRGVFENKLSFLNTLTLRTRLKRLLELTSPAVDMLVDDADAFAELAANTRNYLTHRSQELRQRAASGIELYRLTERMRFVLEICFLLEIGLSLEVVTAIAADHQPYLRFRTWSGVQ